MISKRISVAGRGVMAFLILLFVTGSAMAQASKMYWTFQSSVGCDNSYLARANLDGSEVEALVFPVLLPFPW